MNEGMTWCGLGFTGSQAAVLRRRPQRGEAEEAGEAVLAINNQAAGGERVARGRVVAVSRVRSGRILDVF